MKATGTGAGTGTALRGGTRVLSSMQLFNHSRKYKCHRRNNNKKSVENEKIPYEFALLVLLYLFIFFFFPFYYFYYSSRNLITGSLNFYYHHYIAAVVFYGCIMRWKIDIFRIFYRISGDSVLFEQKFGKTREYIFLDRPHFRIVLKKISKIFDNFSNLMCLFSGLAMICWCCWFHVTSSYMRK